MNSVGPTRAEVLASSSPEVALSYFAHLAPSTIRMGLERMARALDAVGHPEREVPTIHVAGTNGKGSTCAFITSCLSQRYRVGLYTSPHLERPNERIRVNGNEITDEDFARRVREVLARLPEHHELTYFEFGTLLAMWHFAQEKLDICALETGLGGRLDATNLCTPIATAITAIDFDHMEYLGNTLPLIAQEKAGIVKTGVPLISPPQKPDVTAVFERAVAAQNAGPLLLEARDFSLSVPGAYRGPRLSLAVERLGLSGPHQVHNAATALGVLEAIAPLGFGLSELEIQRGLAETRWPGRLERFSGNPPVVLDGAHNPAGIRVLVDALEALVPPPTVHLVFGVFGDKDFRPMMRELFPRVASVALTPVPSTRSWSPLEALDEAQALNACVTAHDTLEGALATAESRSRPPSPLVLIAGSLSLVGQARGLLRARGRSSER